MILITPLPGVTTTKPGSATKPFPGVDAAVVDDHGNEVGPGGGGYLVLKRPWPAMTRGIFGDDARFRATYWERFPGMYFAGDGARDRRGRRLLAARPRRRRDERLRPPHLDDRGRVGARRPPERRGGRGVRSRRRADGQAIVAFVTLKGGEEGSVERLEELRNHVAVKIGPIAKPANIVFTPELPKTRSGKIMRRLLRDVAEDRPLGDTTTLADPAVVSEIADRAVAQPAGGVAQTGESSAQPLERRDGAVDVAPRRRQFETEMRRIAARPSQVVPPIHASPLCLDACSSTASVSLVVAEAEEHLVEDDLVQDLAARRARDSCSANAAREVAAAVDELGDAGAAERAQAA